MRNSSISNQTILFRANSTDKEVSECMRLLKRRAEYEMYADVILVRIDIIFLYDFILIYFILDDRIDELFT